MACMVPSETQTKLSLHLYSVAFVLELTVSEATATSVTSPFTSSTFPSASAVRVWLPESPATICWGSVCVSNFKSIEFVDSVILRGFCRHSVLARERFSQAKSAVMATAAEVLQARRVVQPSRVNFATTLFTAALTGVVIA